LVNALSLGVRQPAKPASPITTVRWRLGKSFPHLLRLVLAPTGPRLCSREAPFRGANGLVLGPGYSGRSFLREQSSRRAQALCAAPRVDYTPWPVRNRRAGLESGPAPASPPWLDSPRGGPRRDLPPDEQQNQEAAGPGGAAMRGRGPAAVTRQAAHSEHRATRHRACEKGPQVHARPRSAGTLCEQLEAGKHLRHSLPNPTLAPALAPRCMHPCRSGLPLVIFPKEALVSHQTRPFCTQPRLARRADHQRPRLSGP
jgi:hypothetical protein